MQFIVIRIVNRCWAPTQIIARALELGACMNRRLWLYFWCISILFVQCNNTHRDCCRFWCFPRNVVKRGICYGNVCRSVCLIVFHTRGSRLK